MVGFRFSAKYKADELDIEGFVRNESDGSIYIEAEGAEKNLEKFLEWCKKGPDFANVRRIEKRAAKVKKYKEFKIEY